MRILVAILNPLRSCRNLREEFVVQVEMDEADKDARSASDDDGPVPVAVSGGGGKPQRVSGKPEGAR